MFAMGEYYYLYFVYLVLIYSRIVFVEILARVTEAAVSSATESYSSVCILYMRCYGIFSDCAQSVKR